MVERQRLWLGQQRGHPGMVKIAAGVDYRRESYSFNGSSAADVSAPDIFNVAFDNVNALSKVNRDVKAAYGEILFPVFKFLELSAAGRVDDYTGFGSTFNPKFTAKLTPAEWLMFRGSYNTGFRVPSFNQIFNGVTQSPNPGNTLVDPTLCPQGNTAGPQPACCSSCRSPAAGYGPDSRSGSSARSPCSSRVSRRSRRVLPGATAASPN